MLEMEWRKDKLRKDRLKNRGGLSSFFKEGMALPAKNGGVENVPYSDFECAVETEDLFLFVYKEQVIVLQKKDLAAEDRREFCSMLTENITKYAVVSFAEQSRAAE